jgi:hypothetical protein
LAIVSLALLPNRLPASQEPPPTDAPVAPDSNAQPVEPSLDVPVTYQASPPCPDRVTFLNEVRRRIEDSTAAAEVESIAVEIAQRAKRFDGRLVLKDHSGDKSTRSINGENCEEVASALALITALALQAKLPSEPEEPIAAEPAAEKEPPTPSAPQPPASQGLRFELDAQFGAASAYAPNPSLTLRAFVGALTNHALFRIGLGYATSAGTRRSLGDADFALLAARADICALLDDTNALTVGLCGSFELGYLRAAGTDSGVLDARKGGTLWAAPGLLGLLRYAPSPAFRLELGAGAQFPLYREQFIFRLANGTDDEIHRIPGVGWLASLGVAYVVQ